jgi:hypothetical protein
VVAPRLSSQLVRLFLLSGPIGMVGSLAFLFDWVGSDP